MSATAPESTDSAGLSDKQRRILAYLQARVDDQTYFKSRCIGEALELSAKEVGTNMQAIRSADVGVDVEKWGYSSSTTWMVTA
jgi:biotin operon repressor